MITVGQRYKFHTSDTEHMALNGETVYVAGKLTADTVDIHEVGDMYEVHFDSGFRLEAFADELKEV